MPLCVCVHGQGVLNALVHVCVRSGSAECPRVRVCVHGQGVLNALVCVCVCVCARSGSAECPRVCVCVCTVREC